MGTSEQDRKTTPVNLGKINVYGAESYDKEYIENLLSPLLSSPVKTIGELAEEGNKVLSELSFLNGFESVNLRFDVDNQCTEKKVDLLDEPLINVIGTIEAKPLKPSLFAFQSCHNELGNALALKYINRNVLGHAGYFQVDSYLNLYDKTKIVDVLSSTPVFGTSVRLFGHLNALKTSEKLFQSKNQAATSAEVGFAKQKYCKHSGALSTTSAGLNLVHRKVRQVEDSANDEVKTYVGDSLKESIFLNMQSSNMTYLTKSKCTLPLHGFAVSLTNELAGFQSLLENSQLHEKADREDQFYKIGLGFDYAKSFLHNNLTLSSNFKFGSIVNFAALSGGTVYFQDKFYPVVSGHDAPIMPPKSVGSGSFLSYNLGFNSKCGLISAEQPLRFYTAINGASASNDLSGFELGELSQLSKDWKHGVDVGLLYTNGDASAKLFWQKPICGGENNIGKVGFQVDITGEW